MKLLREYVSFEDLEFVTENKDNENNTKNYFLRGPFLQANTKNRNGRTYKRKTLMREVSDFYKHKILKHRSMGELDHPPEPTLNLDRISHLITDLKMDGDIGYGEAKLLDTPMGKIAKVLVDDGVQLGMSTRGVGTLNGDTVEDDYKLITVDIVADPSAPTAFVEGVLENKEYILSDGGVIVEVAINNLQQNVDNAIKHHTFDKSEFSSEVLDYLDLFLDSLT
jgi:hypothetical protein